MLEELLDPVHEKVFVDDKGGEGEQVILRDKNGQYWISEPWDDEQPGYPLSVPVPPDLAIINRADLDTHNARVAQLEGQREATERMLFALRKEVAAVKAENALLLERAQVWEPIKYSSPAIKSSGSPYYIESFHNGSVLRVYKFDGTPIILTLPDNIRLCRLASQEK
jgi:hypothetical protein